MHLRLPRELLPLELAQANWTRVAEAGFSGATVYRSDAGYAWKCWPVHFEIQKLQQIHDWLIAGREARLPYIPEIIRGRFGETVLQADGRLWDLATWMPGEATFHRDPTLSKLQAACEALAELHRIWAGQTLPADQRPKVVPSISRRLQLFFEWQQADTEACREEFREADFVLRSQLPEAVRQLREWQHAELAIQPCLCDIWHDHLLYTGESLTGLIDFGAMKFDTPAVDLARILGDLVGTHHPWFAEGLRFYLEGRPPEIFSTELIRLLAWTGDLGALANWFLRFPDLKDEADRQRARLRVKKLLSRIAPVKWIVDHQSRR